VDSFVLEPDWRRQVSDRLHSYRARRHGGPTAALQSALPFEDGASSAVEEADTLQEYVPPAPDIQPRHRRRLRTERVEISIPSREFSYPAAGVHRSSSAQPEFVGAPNGLFAIANLSLRRRAAMLDIALLLFSYGGMLALFWVLGGRIGLNKLDVIVTVATLGLFYAQYFTLFTIFGGRTPGMMLCGLRVLSFDGGLPTSRQMVWRSFGYLVSAGVCFLGFVWALWDEDRLCWQDRMSGTYLTPNEDITRDVIPAISARESGRAG
jgi:uncharacterized RDD family membrane protein YckC